MTESLDVAGHQVTAQHVLVATGRRSEPDDLGPDVVGLSPWPSPAAVPPGQVRQMSYAYPTFHRAIEDALATLG